MQVFGSFLFSRPDTRATIVRQGMYATDRKRVALSDMTLQSPGVAGRGRAQAWQGLGGLARLCPARWWGGVVPIPAVKPSP